MYIPGLERVRIRYLWSRFSHKIDPYSHNRETLFTQKRPILTFVRISYLIFEEIMCTHVRTRSDTCEDSEFMKHRFTQTRPIFTQKRPCLHKRDLYWLLWGYHIYEALNRVHLTSVKFLIYECTFQLDLFQLSALVIINLCRSVLSYLSHCVVWSNMLSAPTSAL